MNQSKPACLEALGAIERDPLVLPAAVEDHLASCPSCSETRVAWLALEETPHVPVPAAYFDQLPARVVRKLPARPRSRSAQSYWWAMAAGLLVAVGAGGFYLGRANRQPLVEATTSEPTEAVPAALPETPFQVADEDLSQLHKLSPRQAKELLDRLDAQEPVR